MLIERTLKALANERRLAILWHLQTNELTVIDIAERIKLSFRSTSKHLRILSNADVVRRRQKSRNVYYRLSVRPHPIVLITTSFAHSCE
ncbi:winged helix-turn-helix transcriptional regulator [Candidatus Uhrbacteria bacterium]|nr:winged helix-turn-helix transcriptional regulator [Candidatus Uhrbacteria bacterium]